MSGFDPEWLALREPVDHASINAALRRALVSRLQHNETISVVDLGCGTGSNLRGLAPWFQQRQHWTLLDYDTALLAAAASAERPSNVSVATARHNLRDADLHSVFANADLVTAAAFFDLASLDLVQRVAAAAAQQRAVFYTVLTYDGIASWLPEHPADGDMRRLFNLHQRGDKGLGPALGPTATDALADAFAGHGYEVLRGRSPWVLAPQNAQLRTQADTGWAGAVEETGQLSNAMIESWLQHRTTHPEAVTIVGHEDLLAVPAA
ncbi:MAG: class I SAM-dependent methyltransferase [Pseudomonadota bacterium]